MHISVYSAELPREPDQIDIYIHIYIYIYMDDSVPNAVMFHLLMPCHFRFEYGQCGGVVFFIETTIHLPILVIAGVHLICAAEQITYNFKSMSCVSRRVCMRLKSLSDIQYQWHLNINLAMSIFLSP